MSERRCAFDVQHNSIPCPKCGDCKESQEGPSCDSSELAAITAAHPTRTGRHDLYAEAMRLVGARHLKSELIDMTTWLLTERDDLRAKLALEKNLHNTAIQRWISQTERVTELEAKLAEAEKYYQLERNKTDMLERAQVSLYERAESAEARVRELEQEARWLNAKLEGRIHE